MTTKQKNMNWIIGLITLLLSGAGIVFFAGGTTKTVDYNTNDIQELKKDVKGIKKETQSLQTTMTNGFNQIQTQMIRIENKVNE